MPGAKAIFNSSVVAPLDRVNLALLFALNLGGDCCGRRRRASRAHGGLSSLGKVLLSPAVFEVRLTLLTLVFVLQLLQLLLLVVLLLLPPPLLHVELKDTL